MSFELLARLYAIEQISDEDVSRYPGLREYLDNPPRDPEMERQVAAYLAEYDREMAKEQAAGNQIMEEQRRT